MSKDQIAIGSDEASEVTRPEDSVTQQRKFVDPHGEGKETEARDVSPTSGASSNAPPESGIPSAKKQADKP